MDNFENQNIYENNQVGGNVPPVDYQPKFNPETGEPLYNQQMNQPKFDSETGEPLTPQYAQPQYNQPNDFAQNQYNQPNGYTQNQYNQTGGYTPNQYTPNSYQPIVNGQEDGKNFAIASLVLGILSYFCCGTICAILGLIFGIVSLNKQKEKNGMAVAGIILSAIALVLGAIAIICYIVFTADAASTPYYSYY